MERARGQRRAQVTQLSLWKQIEGSCGFEPPKVLLEHRLFNRREKQCYSCFLHHRVFPTSKYSRDWVIMLWSGIRWIVFFFLLLCSFPCGGIDSSVQEISVISVVIAHSLAPSAMLALKHTLCVSGQGDCSLSLLLNLTHSIFLCLCFLLCLLNVTYYFPTRQTGGNSDVKQPAYPFTVRSVNAVECLCVCVCVWGSDFVICHEYMNTYISISSVEVVYSCMYVCVFTVCGATLWYKGALSGSAVWIRSQGS